MNMNFDQQVKRKSNEELLEIYLNAGNYQREFYDCAVTEIAARNISFDAIDKIKQTKDQAEVAWLSVGKQGSPLYIALCFCLALLGGIPAFISGYIYGFSKQKGPDRVSYYVYNESTRKMGIAMIVVGTIVVFITFNMR